MQDDVFLGIECARSELYYTRSLRRPELFAWAGRQLEAIKRTCDAHGSALAVVILPDELQVSESLQREVVDGYWAKQRKVSASEIDFRLPNTYLHGELDRIGVRYVDLVEPFAAAGRSERLYRLNNTHWNVRGNALAAELVVDSAVREGLIRR